MGAVDITVRVQNRQYIDAFVDNDNTEYREFVSQFCDEVRIRNNLRVSLLILFLMDCPIYVDIIGLEKFSFYFKGLPI